MFQVSSPTAFPGYPGKSDVAHGYIASVPSGGFIDAGGEQVNFNVLLTTGTVNTPPFNDFERAQVAAVLNGGESSASWDGAPLSDEEATNILPAMKRSGGGSAATASSYAGALDIEVSAILGARDGGTAPVPEPVPPAGELIAAGYISNHDYQAWMSGVGDEMIVTKNAGDIYVQLRTYPGTSLPPVDSGGIGIDPHS